MCGVLAGVHEGLYGEGSGREAGETAERVQPGELHLKDELKNSDRDIELRYYGGSWLKDWHQQAGLEHYDFCVNKAGKAMDCYVCRDWDRTRV